MCQSHMYTLTQSCTYLHMRIMPPQLSCTQCFSSDSKNTCWRPQATSYQPTEMHFGAISPMTGQWLFKPRSPPTVAWLPLPEDSFASHWQTTSFSCALVGGVGGPSTIRLAVWSISQSCLISCYNAHSVPRDRTGQRDKLSSSMSLKILPLVSSHSLRQGFSESDILCIM